MILQLLDVLIGLTLVYLIFSTAASIGVELLESWLRRRGKLLERGIGEILSQIIGGAGQDGNAAAKAMVRQLYDSPFVYSLYEGDYEVGGSKLPSAIPAARFAGAVIALAAEHEDFRKAANTMLKVAGLKLGDDDAKVRAALAAYFDESMERVTGWYRRHVQWVLLAIGAVLAIALNADTLNIVRTLSQDDVLRAKIVATAVGVQGEGQAPAPVCKEATADCERQLAQQVSSQLELASNLGLPLGWNLGGTGIGLPACVPKAGEQTCSRGRAFASGALFVITKILGLALTALATTLGAPFWFDLLNRLIQTRNVVAPAKAAIDQARARKRPEPDSETESKDEPAANDDDASDPDPGPNKPRTARTPRRRRSSPRPPRTPAA
ncbi:hypothetical protein [Nevskia sp.]|uniref:hypothetical protein n=1 Tax=Nevskia sp. TaxID=1929292 RepID=UPI0025F56F87|nr:hypothetical protein [Nevskia sp.]